MHLSKNKSIRTILHVLEHLFMFYTILPSTLRIRYGRIKIRKLRETHRFINLLHFLINNIFSFLGYY